MYILSYNLLKHRAASELQELAKSYHPDVLCLQEAKVSQLPESFGPLHLAISTEHNRLGLAIYYNSSRYKILRQGSFHLKDATYDKIAKPAHERLLGAQLTNRRNGKLITVGSFHASPLTALNSVRREQIKSGLESLNILGEGSPLVMLGDYNYPVFRKRLQKEITEAGYEVKFSDRHTYNSLVRGHFDFMVGKAVSVRWLRTLQQGVSDHLPIMAGIEVA